MWIKLFQKEGTFAYKRLFFILLSVVFIVGVAFTGYTMYKYDMTQKNVMESTKFFEQHQTELLKYKEKRSVYLGKYGMPQKVTKNEQKQQITDTYLSKDGSKGITLIYRQETKEMNDAYVIGYFVIGKQVRYNESQFQHLEGQVLKSVMEKLGSGDVFTESVDDTFEIGFKSDEQVYFLKGDGTSEIITEVTVKSLG